MTVVVGYTVDGQFRMATDTRVSYESGDIGSASKVYCVGDWMIGESGEGEPLGVIRRALRKAAASIITIDDLSGVVYSAIKDVDRKHRGCTLLCHHPADGLFRVEEDVDPATPQFHAGVTAIGSGTDFVFGWLSSRYMYRDVDVSDDAVEEAIRRCANVVPSVAGYELHVRT
jgi:20S proteasome alpha/beta subunit